MAHRILWSAVFFGAIVALQGRIGSVLALLGARALRVRLVASTVFVSSNWFLFIWAVQSGRTVESSLGYYIAPLMAVIVGRVYFGERLSSLRWTATALAALGVMILAAWLGAPPWVSLAIALTFTLYGVAKRGLDAPALISVLAEVLLLAPIALFWIAVMVPGKGAMVDPVDAGLLLLSGPLTALPLILFSYASRRMTLATLGVVGYLNPTLQFVGAVTILGEPVTAVHLLAFGLIWTALALYSAAAFRRERRTGGDIAAREKVATDPPPP
ncbi:chloramphenicol-sensitive protein RarD [Palleronia aestuarii]|uniref:Chloramphenicol-sensitive protein RarD n=2 Tax=Palleronia aestuarii TaxID=568105 RepID=A0A2W7NHC7_9RHOB|nr:chloramphenicol-sensitive protein RarD [Palleronia aestuarii]